MMCGCKVLRVRAKCPDVHFSGGYCAIGVNLGCVSGGSE